MCKQLIISELTTLFRCTEDQLWKGAKLLLKYILIYVGIMLLTFVLAASFATMGGTFGLLIGAILSFLTTLEIALLSTAVTIMVLMPTIYYGAYFAAKGWNRT